MKEIWDNLPPWLRTFVRGLIFALLVPVIAAVKDPGFAEHLVTDPQAVLAALTLACTASALHYLKDRLAFTLAEALAGGGVLVGVAGVLVGYLYVPIATQVDAPTPGIENGTTIVRPFEPGTGFSVAEWCNRPDVEVIQEPPSVDVLGVKRIARLKAHPDQDYVEWADANTPRGPSTGAKRHYVDKDGTNKTDLVDVVTTADVSCMRTPR